MTFAEWDACVAAGGCRYKPDDNGWGRGDRPVIRVSWLDAQVYVKWLSARTHNSYRLLSEAEWEYAARAGTSTPYPWGEKASHDFANYGAIEGFGGFAEGRDKWLDETAPTGSFPANRFGLFDMNGNVYELLLDCYGPYDPRELGGAPAGLDDEGCSSRVMRGGSWNHNARYLRSAYRNYATPGVRFNRLGFRIGRTL